MTLSRHRKILRKSLLLFSALIFSLVATKAAFSQVPATIEVGTASLPATNTPNATSLSPFTRIEFDIPFADGTTPNVFPMTPEFGAGADDDPCTIRIRNIDETGFEAACLEPRNEDRDGPAVNFDYIAIRNGILDVPIVGSSDTVTFESRCSDVSSQVFGPNCANCTITGSQSYTPQTFMSTFAAAPALLTQISSTSNTISGGAGLPIGEPEFLEATVRTNSLSSAGFDWTLGRLEAGNGSISNSEQLCYLAVEREGCLELDFSGLGGPASVDFVAVFGDNVDGHDNGATSGEGASFPAGCFSSTPVTLGGSRSRRGNNGGFLRKVSENTAGVIFTYDEDRISDTERSHIDEDVSAIAFSSTFTTPVTLNKIKVTQIGRRTSFAWETASEIFHLGFHLWGETDTGWEQLNKRLIVGTGVDSNETRKYTKTIRLNRRLANQVSRFGISSIDNNGDEQFYGPFELNVDYGSGATNEPVDWSLTRKAFESKMLKKGFVKAGQRWRRVSSGKQRRIVNRQLGANRQVLNLEFDQIGIHAVPAASILQLAPHWEGKELERLALTLNGDAVARDIISTDEWLSSGDTIIFNVKSVSGSDAIYIANYNYQLRIDRSKARNANRYEPQTSDIDGDEFSNSGMQATVATQDKVYRSSIAADTPWVDQTLLTRGNRVNKDYSINLEELDDARPAQLRVKLHGGINLPGDTDDHHVEILVNNQLVDNAVFDGLTPYSKHIQLAPGLLTNGDNTVTVSLVGDTGFFADLVLVDDISLLAPIFLGSSDSYDFISSESIDGYELEISNASEARVYAYTSTGLLSRVSASANLDNTRLSFSNLTNAQQLKSDLRFSIAKLQDLPRPTLIESANIKPLHQTVVNTASNDSLIVIAHPNFIGTRLHEYLDFKRQQGLAVELIDWLDLVETYGYGNALPQALDNFLAHAYVNGVDKTSSNNVLLVGGHTYDYLGNLNNEIVNFIPSHYSKVSIFNFAPSDNAFADLNNDNLPELSIGRWPVRTEADLDVIISKSISWHTRRLDTPYQSALMISQTDDSSGLNFSKQVDMRVKLPLSNIDEFDQIEHISMNELAAAGVEEPIRFTRETLEAKINEGLDVLSFAGHASFGFWGFNGIVDTNFVKSLNNAGKPIVVMPLACYTSNYENPSINTLAHQWLFAGEQGAAAIHGASVLGEYRENAIFAERYLRQVQSSKTIGEAIMNAKNEMASSNQMLHNWAYLGDPSLPLR